MDKIGVINMGSLLCTDGDFWMQFIHNFINTKFPCTTGT